MKEYIEREAVIYLITRRYECPEICTAEINSIPAADVVERKRGECKFCKDLDWLYEVVCYHPNDNGGATDIPINFCPNCGADMRENA